MRLSHTACFMRILLRTYAPGLDAVNVLAGCDCPGSAVPQGGADIEITYGEGCVLP